MAAPDSMKHPLRIFFACFCAGWVLAAPIGLRGENAPGQSEPYAAAILRQALSLHTGSSHYSAIIYRRRLVVTKQKENVESSSDYEIDSSGTQVTTLRVSGPFNLYIETEQFGYIIGSAPGRSFLLAKAGQNTGRFSYLENRDLKAEPLPDELLLARLRGSLDISMNTVVEYAMFGRSSTGDTETWDYPSAEVQGTGDFDGEPVDQIRVGSTKGKILDLWIAKASHMILRTIVITPATTVPADSMQIVETLYHPTLHPKFTSEDFGYTFPTRRSDLTESTMGFSDPADLRAYLPIVKAPPPPASQLSGVVLIEGEQGVATGFFARIHDVPCVVTNMHVLVGNPNIKVKDLKGDVVPILNVIGAVGSDIALLRLRNPDAVPTLLPLAPDVLKAVRVGDKVLVIGNRFGGGVATELPGALRGVGSNRIEVDAAFQPGNSGSPIFKVDTGEVIGIATYSEVVAAPAWSRVAVNGRNSTPESEQRWFGYRLDRGQVGGHRPGPVAGTGQAGGCVSGELDGAGRLFKQ